MVAARIPIVGTVVVALLATAGAFAARANRDAFISSAIAPAAIANAAVVGRAEVAEVGAIEPNLRTVRSSDGLFYITAHVNGKPLRFLVDTGASVVVLTGADAKTAGLQIGSAHYNANVQTVGGSAQMAWATLDRLEVAGRQVPNLKAAVVANGLGVSLLGQNAISRLGAITIEGDKLSMH